MICRPWFIVLFALLVAVAVSAEGQSQNEAWQNVVESAIREGQVSIYGGQEVAHPDIVAAFSKEFPKIKVLTTTGRGADLLNRIVAERRADRYLADVIASGPNGPRSLYLAKALDPLPPALLLPEVTDGSKWYGGKHWYADPENQYIFMFEGTTVSTSLSYNTKLLAADEIKSFWDLLAPKWKGRLLSLDPRGSVPPTPVLIWYHREDLGAAFIRRFYTETEMTLFRDRRQGTNWLATGKFSICYMCRDIDKARQQGLDVDVMLPDRIKEAGGIGGGGSSVISLINKAPHPSAARVFINWYLSRQGQVVWQSVMNKKEVEASDSMRVDISKDHVLAEGRRAEGRKYHVIGFLDPNPVQKLLREIVK
jgi:iron(III) transport system substrate-binding protein